MTIRLFASERAFLRDHDPLWFGSMLGRFFLSSLLAGSVAIAEPIPAHWKNAPSPPMGWNSWDCFGTTLGEEEAKLQADAMAQHLAPLRMEHFHRGHSVV